jgi:hypothetical protein
MPLLRTQHKKAMDCSLNEAYWYRLPPRTRWKKGGTQYRNECPASETLYPESVHRGTVHSTFSSCRESLRSTSLKLLIHRMYARKATVIRRTVWLDAQWRVAHTKNDAKTLGAPFMQSHRMSGYSRESANRLAEDWSGLQPEHPRRHGIGGFSP